MPSFDFLVDATIWTAIFIKAFTLFLTFDPLGNVGLIATVVRRYPPQKQLQILRREVMIALLIVVIFYFFGATLLGALGISQAAVEITGGFVLILFSLTLLNPKDAPIDLTKSNQEPLIVPIALPLFTGPSSLATVMLYARQPMGTIPSLIAIFGAWACAALIISYAPYLIRLIGESGTRMAERLMGLICGIIAVKMFLTGIETFIETKLSF